MYNTKCESEWTVYVLPVLNKVMLMQSAELKTAAYTYGKFVETDTSEGLVVPRSICETVVGARVYDSKTDVKADLDTTSEKARESERVFKEWAEGRGMHIELHTDIEHQLRGIDATIDSERTIQIKYDGKAHKTGNIYFETAEINPTKSH